MRKPGCIEPVFYFENGADPAHPRGYLMLAPYSDMPAPVGWTKSCVDTLPGVDWLELKLYQQEKAEWEKEAERDATLLRARCEQVRDSLLQTLHSAQTSEWEKDFIRLYLDLRTEKRAKARQRYTERSAYLWARHNDTPKGRQVDQERVSLDRVSF